MARRLRARIVVWREDGAFVAREVSTGVTSQGGSLEEALRNVREALEALLEEEPWRAEHVETVHGGFVGVVEVEAEAPEAIRARAGRPTG